MSSAKPCAAGSWSWLSHDFELARRSRAEPPGLFQVLTNLLAQRHRDVARGVDRQRRDVGHIGDARLVVIDSGPGVDPSRREHASSRGLQRTIRAGPASAFATRYALAASRGGILSLGASTRGARFEVTWPVVSLRPPDVAHLFHAQRFSRGGAHPLARRRRCGHRAALDRALAPRRIVFPARTPGEFQTATEARNLRRRACSTSLPSPMMSAGRSPRCEPVVRAPRWCSFQARRPRSPRRRRGSWRPGFANPSRWARSSRSCGTCRAPEGKSAQPRQLLDIARAPLMVRRLLHREGGGIGRRTSLRC